MDASETLKKNYYKYLLIYQFRIISLRADYFEGSDLYTVLKESDISNSNRDSIKSVVHRLPAKNNPKGSLLPPPLDKANRRNSFSKFYIQEFDRASVSSLERAEEVPAL